MATSYPGALDNFSNPAGTDPLSNPSHAAQHANVNDAVEALQAKVGVNNSSDPASLENRLNNFIGLILALG
jgi:hypothetical protein